MDHSVTDPPQNEVFVGLFLYEGRTYAMFLHVLGDFLECFQGSSTIMTVDEDSPGQCHAVKGIERGEHCGEEKMIWGISTQLLA